jgi:hypothetical protein
MSVARLLHAAEPNALFRLFDDEERLQQFKEWEIHHSDKSKPYPKQWADAHYIADIQQVRNSGTKKWEWQLVDPQGRKIASLN